MFTGEKVMNTKIMTKQVVWAFREFFFLQFDTKFASKQQRLAKIGTILWLLLATQISQIWLTTDNIRWKKSKYYQAHIPRSWPLPYLPLLVLPQKAGSFKFKLECIGEESEWKIISSQAGGGFFGHNELNLINLSFIINTRTVYCYNSPHSRVRSNAL